jgi:hypothetical protein
MKTTERKRRLITFAGVLAATALVVVGLVLFWPSQQGCAGAGCGAGSQYCASGCCLGTTVVDVVNGCQVRSWGCAPQWSLSNTFTCGGGCDGNYDQKGCSATWISVPVYITTTCSEQECSEVCGWKYYMNCRWVWTKVCYGPNNKICEYDWVEVCSKVWYWDCHDECTTVYYTCQRFWGYEQQVSSCSLVSNPAWTNCCGSGPPPTNTPQPPPPPTNTPQPPPPPTNTPQPPPATSTPIPTATSAPTATATVSPLTASLTPRYGSLLLMAPRLGLPAQTLNGAISGGIAPYAVTLHVQAPDNSTASFGLSGGSFSFGPGEAGDANFGVSQEGTWRAWFTVTDTGGRIATSNTVTWQVVFYPVHGVP